MKRLFAILMDCAWLGGLYFGLIHGIEGALNVGIFLTWFMFVLSFGLFNKDVAAETNDIPVWAMARSVAFDLAAIALLVWHGMIITAIAAVWACLIGFGTWNQQRRRKAA